MINIESIGFKISEDFPWVTGFFWSKINPLWDHQQRSSEDNTSTSNILSYNSTSKRLIKPKMTSESLTKSKSSPSLITSKQQHSFKRRVTKKNQTKQPSLKRTLPCLMVFHGRKQSNPIHMSKLQRGKREKHNKPSWITYQRKSSSFPLITICHKSIKLSFIAGLDQKQRHNTATHSMNEFLPAIIP